MPDKFFAGYSWDKGKVFEFFSSLQIFADKNEQSMSREEYVGFINEQDELIAEYADRLEELARRLGSNYVSMCLYDYLNSREMAEQQRFGRKGNFRDSLSLVLCCLDAPIVPLAYCITQFKGPALDLSLAASTLNRLKNKRDHLSKKLCEELAAVDNCYIIGTSGLVLGCLHNLLETAFTSRDPLHIRMVDYGNLSKPENELQKYAAKAERWGIVDVDTLMREVERNNNKNMILLPTRLWSSFGIVVHRGVSDVVKKIHREKTKKGLNVMIVAPAGGFKLYHYIKKSDECVREEIELAGQYEYVEFKFLDRLIVI